MMSLPGASEADLRGLTPEQVAQAVSLNNQSEQLRQQSIARIFEANERLAQARFLGGPQTAQTYAAAGELEERARRSRETLATDIDATKAEAEARRARAQLDTALGKRTGKLTDFEAGLLQAQTVDQYSQARNRDILTPTIAAVNRMQAKDINSQTEARDALLEYNIEEVYQRARNYGANATETEKLIKAKLDDYTAGIAVKDSLAALQKSQTDFNTKSLAKRLEELSTDVELKKAMLELRKTETSQLIELFGTEKALKIAQMELMKKNGERTQQEIDRGYVMLGIDVGKANAEMQLIQRSVDEWTDVQLPGATGTTPIRGRDLLSYLINVAERNELIARNQQAQVNRKEDQVRKDSDTAFEAEQEIATRSVKGYGTTRDMKAELAPSVQKYHQFSDKGYIYAWTFKGENRYEKFNIPKDSIGKQYNAKQIHKIANGYGMDVQSYMESVFYPTIGQKAPWL